MKHKYLLSRLVLAGAFLGLSLQANAQNQSQREMIRSEYNLQKLKTLEQNFQKTNATERKKAFRIAKQKGWKTKITTSDGRYMELQKVVDGKPIYYTTFNVAAAKSTRTNHLNNGGSLNLNLMGQEMTAYVWDGGIARATHQEYDGAGGNNRYSVGDGHTTKHYHAAHVTGTIMASGVQANAKGMAPHSKVIGYHWTNDKTEATTAATAGMLISNHSYGYATRNQFGQVQLPQHYFGGYIAESRAWDEILFNAPNYLMVVAAGNDGNDNSANTNPTGGSGWDKLTGHSVSKNNLVVANAQDATIAANGTLTSVSINSSSSEGPTDDMRIKPDITGNGTAVYSTYEGSDTAYNSITGTSMASPNVTGTLLLLQQHYKNLNSGSFMKAATLKGLALHTADDAGASGPDAVFGWGLLNAKKAAEAISQKGNQAKIEELTLSANQTYTITVDSDGTNPLLASISWTDRPGTANTTVNSTTPVLVNDLDIRVSKSGTTYLPYELTSPTTSAKRDNNVDPYERVDVSGASGTYTITVTHKGSLTGGSQNYSLIVTGITGTPVVCNATVPTGVSTSSITSSGASINWTAVSNATYDVRYKAASASSWTTSAASTTTKALSGLSASTQYEVQVRSKCSSGNSAYSASVNFTTSAVQVNYCASSGNTTYQTGISRVIFGSIDKVDGPAKNVGYENFTSLSTTVTQSSSVNLKVHVNTDGNYRIDAFAWIDWNQDGDFTDSGEAYDLGNISNVSNGALTTLAVSIPANAKIGSTRMRVSARYNSNPTSCQTNFDGEVEDYTVNVTAAVADTQAPTAPTSLAATNITQTTLTLNWSASTDNVAVTEYDVYQGATKIGSTANTTTNITGLTAATAYTFSVKAKDAAGNVSTSSNIANITTLNTVVSYCASKGNRVTYEWIDYVSFGGMTNTTAANGGYGDFTTTKTATVAKGSVNQLIVSAGFASSAYTEHFAVWIDYNRNGTFEASEKVTSGSSNSAANRTANITIPTSALVGQTRMRVSMKYNSAPTSCETFADGEVEDYTVNITATGSSSFDVNTIDSNPLGSNAVSDFMVFPNPAKDFIQVHFAKAKNLTFKIVNLVGKTIKSGIITNNTMNISDLKTGIYLLKVNDGQKSMTTKLVKK